MRFKLKIALVFIFLNILANPIFGQINIFSLGFEDSTLDTTFWKKIHNSLSTIEVSSDTFLTGNQSLKFTFIKDDPKNRRAEITGKPWSNVTYDYGEEYWFRINHFIPTDWAFEECSIIKEIVTQWHHRQSHCCGGPPNLAIKIKGDQWEIENNYGTLEVSSSCTPDSCTFDMATNAWQVGTVERNKWTEWVVHVKWSNSSSGLLEIWKDRQQVVDYQGPTAYEDINVYWKMGIYKAKWWYSDSCTTSVSTRELYIDDIIAADHNSSYDKMITESWWPDSLSESTYRYGPVAIGKDDPNSFSQLHLWKDVDNGIGPVLLLENPQYNYSSGAGSLIRFQGYQENRYIDIHTEMENYGKPKKLAIAFNLSGDTTEALTIRRPNGSGDVYVGIGDTQPSYPLVVNGEMVSKEIITTAELDKYPDYVFSDSYELMELKSLERFINEKGHLPDVPTSKDIQMDSLKLSAFSSILLRKIEELTLYSIENYKSLKENREQLENALK